MNTLPSNPRVTYKNATQADLLEYYGDYPPYTLKALVFYVDGELAGIGGWKIENGSYVVFSEIRENVTIEKATVFRCARIVMKMVAEQGSPMYAATDNQRLLEKLGFKPFETVSDNREFFVWHS